MMQRLTGQKVNNGEMHIAILPTQYRYDTYGRLAQMHTFRSELGWSGNTWPTGSDSAADVTKWHYQDETGLLIAKEDAQGKQVTYTYETGGRLKTRTWARTDSNNPLITTYNYDPDTGELTLIDYSDQTPDIAFTYDRLGRQKTVTDALGSRTFGYNSSLQLETETITGLYNKTITRTYETSDVIGRNTGFTLNGGYSVSYGFDSKGRFNSVGWNVSAQTGMATYGYLPNSNLLESVTTLAAKNTTYAYEPHRNLRTQVQNSSSGQVMSQYDYQYDEIGRRTSVQNSGLAFGTPAFNKWGYNDRSELTESKRYNGTDINNLSLPVDPETRLFQYDPIGNRNSSTKGTESSTYSANNLNQYESVTTGGNPKPLVYDDDGNLTSYDGKVLKFNGENRLISVEPASPAIGDKKVEFIYDFMGRRIKKSVYAFAGTWQFEKEILFVYNGWNLVEEITKVGASETSKFYVYGLDLSQSLQGAGGVGGLLATIDNGTTYYHFYDANGNTGQLVNSSDGFIAASYEYDPYGQAIKVDGAYAQENKIRFSAKYWDDEIRIGYWGYRYYDPELGRWINRDPIGEAGGFSIYALAGNNPINNIDTLGLWKKSSETGQERQTYIREGDLDTLQNLAQKIGLDYSEIKKWAEITGYRDYDLGTFACEVSVPNLWIVANLMHGGDMVDWGLSIGGKVGFDYAPEGVKIVKESDINYLTTTIDNNKGNILGFVMYAHGDQFGYIYNTANWLWGSADKIHTLNILRAIDKNGFKISEAHPMQCYSIFSGTASYTLKNSWFKPVWDLTGSPLFNDLRYRLNLNPIVNNTYDNMGNLETSTINLTVNLKTEWQNRVFKPVDGYVGMNVIGFDTNPN